jgi:NADH-quinone oxidoreductase subunit N
MMPGVSLPVAAVPVTWADIGGVLPVIVLFGTGIAVLGIDLFLRGWNDPEEAGEKPVLHFLSLLGTVVSGALVMASLVTADPEPRSYFLGAIQVDGFSSILSLLIVLGTLLTFLGAADTLRRRRIEHGEFHALVLFSAGSMVLFTQSSSLIMAFLSLETLSMGVYVLTAYTRDEKRSVEGALKYFVLGGLSTAFLLLGLVFLYGATGELTLAGIRAVLRSGAAFDGPLTLAGMALAVVGLAFKVGAFPFHSWVPDAYEGAASVVTGFMAVTVKVASIAVLLRIGLVLSEASSPGTRQALIAALGTLSVLTMFFGNLVAIVQKSVKRMLAYSAIAHTGYLLVGVVAALDGAGGGAAAGRGAGAAVIFYLFPYALATAGAFTMIAHAGAGEGERETFLAYRGLSRRDPLIALAILVLMISFAGIPPTPGFWGKFYIFREALETGHWGLALAGIVASVASMYYYLRLVVVMYMQPAEDETPLALEGRSWSGLAILLSVAAVIALGLFPEVFLEVSARCGIR